MRNFFLLIGVIFFLSTQPLENEFLSAIALQTSAEKIDNKKITIYLQGEIQPNWHIYSIHKNPNFPFQTKLEILNKNWLIKNLEESKTIPIFDEIAENILLVHKDVFQLKQVAQWQKNSKLPNKINLQFHFQICNQLVCSLPQIIQLKTDIL